MSLAANATEGNKITHAVSLHRNRWRQRFDQDPVRMEAEAHNASPDPLAGMGKSLPIHRAIVPFGRGSPRVHCVRPFRPTFLFLPAPMGSVATRLRYGGTFYYRLTRNLLLSLSVREL